MHTKHVNVEIILKLFDLTTRATLLSVTNQKIVPKLFQIYLFTFYVYINSTVMFS